MYVLEWKSKALVEENFQPQHAHVTMAEGNNSLNTNAPRLVSAMIYHTRWNQRDVTKLAIKFPTPYIVIKCPAPGRTKFIEFPPSRAAKDVKCPGYARGGDV